MSTEQIQWHSMEGWLTRSGPFALPNFEPGVSNIENLQNEKRVLVVGAGGLGCEILKNLALSGFRDIHVIDLDTIDLSNLNRQFLFRRKDVGRFKAEVAAEFIMKRCPGVVVKAFTQKIQDYSLDWYRKFDIIIAGLDNVEARRWLNQTLNELVTYDDEGNIDPSSIIPLIDGGTEGFKGQARLFFPKVTSCFECSLDSMPQDTHFHQCTIASTPRIPEHCIQYIKEILWPMLEDFKSCDEYKLYQKKNDGDEYIPNKVALDKDDPQHMSWIYNRSLERAKQFNISGVTFKLTQQVVKNIIPAIASTNALISASCVQEALKCATYASVFLDNFMLFNGVNLKGCMLHSYAKKENCVCRLPKFSQVKPDMTVGEFRKHIQQEFSLEDPSLFHHGILYLRTQHEQWKENLDKKLGDVVKHKQQLRVVDSNKKEFKLVVLFSS